MNVHSHTHTHIDEIKTRKIRIAYSRLNPKNLNLHKPKLFRSSMSMPEDSIPIIKPPIGQLLFVHFSRCIVQLLLEFFFKPNKRTDNFY